MVGLRSYLLGCAAGSVTLGAGMATGVAAAIVRMVANANEGVLGGDLLSLIRRYAALRAGAGRSVADTLAVVLYAAAAVLIGWGLAHATDSNE